MTTSKRSQRSNQPANRSGFSLVELVIVITILGIVAAVAMPRMARSQEIRRHHNVEMVIKSQFALAQDRAITTGRPQALGFVPPQVLPGGVNPATIWIVDNIRAGTTSSDPVTLVASTSLVDDLEVRAAGTNGGGFHPMIDVSTAYPSAAPMPNDNVVVFDTYGQPNVVWYTINTSSAGVPTGWTVQDIKPFQSPNAASVRYRLPGVSMGFRLFSVTGRMSEAIEIP